MQESIQERNVRLNGELEKLRQQLEATPEKASTILKEITDILIEMGVVSS